MSSTVKVALGGRSYDIHIGQGLMQQAGSVLKPVLRSPRAIIITDKSVAKLHLENLVSSLKAGSIDVAEPIVVATGEQTKSLAGFEDLIEQMLDRAMERSVTVIALGGGVVGDLAGFAAATVLRGVDFIQIPTTLLAQVDSSVGGKTGINTRHGKNLLGAFHQPRAVLIDTDVLNTLPRREMLAGYAEIIKYGLIDDAEFYNWCLANSEKLMAGDNTTREYAIAHSCAAKARIVAADELESGPRMLLNFGHTFAHALEAEAGYGAGLLHGEAVAVGMVLALELSARLGLCSPELAPNLAAHFKSVGMPASIADTPCKDTAPQKLLEHMYHDKKVEDGKLTFILARGIGQTFISRGIDPAQVLPVLGTQEN